MIYVYDSTRGTITLLPPAEWFDGYIDGEGTYYHSEGELTNNSLKQLYHMYDGEYTISINMDKDGDKYLTLQNVRYDSIIYNYLYLQD